MSIRKCKNELCDRDARSNMRGFCQACYHRQWLISKGLSNKRKPWLEQTELERAQEAYKNACTLEARLRFRAIIDELESKKAAN